VPAPDAPGTPFSLAFRRPVERPDPFPEEDDVHTSRRTAGLGLLAYGLGTAAAFTTIGSPGGDYSDADVTAYLSRGHWWTAFALAYLGAFAAVGFLVAARHLRAELRSAGELFWGLAVGATAVGVVGWFLVGGVAVAAAEGGPAVATVPHPVVYTLTEMGNLVAACASAFLIGLAALVLAARSRLPRTLRAAAAVAGVCGVLGAFFFPIFLFWLWVIGTGVWALVSRPEPADGGQEEDLRAATLDRS
jgi:hypothetical protein